MSVMLRYLQFSPGLCATCKAPVTSVLLVGEDGLRWFVNLRSMPLHRPNEASPPVPIRWERLTEHEHPHWKNTEIQHVPSKPAQK